MSAVLVQTGVSLGRQLVFFLFLLVPGYLAVRAYYWANVALENDARVNRLVLMAIGGFVSLASVALWRQVGPNITTKDFCIFIISNYIGGPVSGVFSGLVLQFYLTTSSQISLIPEYFIITGEISPQLVSRLTILESANLILSQSLISLLLGYFWGSIKYAWYDKRQREHTDLERPWEQVVDRAAKGDVIKVVTSDGECIIGEVEALGSPTREYDVLLANAQRIDQENGQSQSSSLMYFYREEIARLLLQQDDTSTGTTPLQEKHERVTRWLDNQLPSNLPNDETGVDQGDSYNAPPSDDE